MSPLATTRAIDRDARHIYTYREGKKVFGPFPGATAICALQDSIGGSDGLMTWGVNLALDEVEKHADSGVPWAEVRRRALLAKDRPRNMGTAVHAVVDQLNQGQTVEMFTEGVAPYVAQYGAALFQRGIKILGSERYAVNTKVGFGGTYDSLVEIDGERGPLDVKTGKEKPSQILQITGISMCEWHAEAGMEAEPMPTFDGVGFILLLRPDGYTLRRHVIRDEDRNHFINLVRAYHQIRQWATTVGDSKPIGESVPRPETAVAA